MPYCSVDQGVEFREIMGFDCAYCVGSNGTVWSRWTRSGRGWCLGETWRELRPGTDHYGYLLVCLCCKGERNWWLVNRLVLTVFVGPCPDGMMSLHRNNNPADNRLDNLHWGTMRENQADRIVHGTSNRGEQHGCSKLTAAEVMAIRRRLNCGDRASNLAREYLVDPSTISDIKRRKLWRHLV